ncbi:MAG: EF-P 5-aminopentanol modification-associated protein YfmF [Tepidibacillus sp.]|uniref:EF-P 5-aminopentanol modification-associated protein YfmF n=1 Tax=Tepidibacillus sp. HK-1 TaxID=1883407 RepID=UPI000853A508|nr:pitrilysin family protein [Tepidibacillus sp. HK-1]GBF11311.1 antilisterial bacteriocin subtilosin biosynthesis protein AlbE [Tepidibacillus sp. HK-1]
MRLSTSQINNITVHYLQTNKFKTNTIVLNIVQELTEEDVTKISLIPNILKRGTAHLLSNQMIQEKLDQLYGALFHVNVFKRGEKQIVQFNLEVANEKFIKEAINILAQSLHLLSDLLTNPYTVDEGFNPDFVQSEKQLLANRINSILDDKIQYAEMKMIDHMCKEERYHLLPDGKIEDLDHITAKNLYDFYQSWVKTSPIDLFIVGDFNSEELLLEIQRLFHINHRKVKSLSPTQVHVPVNQEKVIVEELDVKQGKLNIGLRTFTSIQDDDYVALLLYNGILGGFSHSKLFVNVREKASLAYYAVSRLDSHKGIMTIQSGIEIENYDKAVQIIKEQLKLMKDGQISNQEFEQTKAVLSNQLREMLDRPRQLIDFEYHSVLSQKNRSLDQILKGIERTTIDEITQVAQKIKIDTIYFLKDRKDRS